MADEKENIIRYVENNMVTFNEKPFCTLDAAVLCQLFYIRIEAIAFNDEYIKKRKWKLNDFYLGEFFHTMFQEKLDPEENKELFMYVLSSPRYRDLQIRNIQIHFDEKKEEQFAAAIYELDEDTDFVVFRGTDETLLGWKEDFNMSFTDVVPSQISAVQYLNDEYGKRRIKTRKKNIIAGGHSKGGNLAVYAAAMCNSRIQDHIKHVYSFDGPGFREDVWNRVNKVFVEKKIERTKLVPQTSIIGMLMEETENYLVVRSTASLLWQHSMFTWAVEYDDFVYLDELSSGSKYAEMALANWIYPKSDEEKQKIVETVYKMCVEENMKTTKDLSGMSLKQIWKVIDSLRHIDDAKDESDGGAEDGKCNEKQLNSGK